MHLRSRRPALWISLLLAIPSPASATAQPQGIDMADMSIEDLANIQITSVSKKPERLAAAAAAVYVITADDIRRSGAASIPEALRLAPNLQVAQVTNSAYAVTARGLNGSNNSAPNKLLVMIDGRSVYAPLFSGVFWETQEVVLEDIERIEVISGPGGTLWGVNAVNGVVNITTRNAAESRGTLVSLRAGERGSDAAFRQGGGKSGAAWTVYGKYQDLRHSKLDSGARVNDARHLAQLGFRVEFERGADRLTMNGNAYSGRSRQAEPGSISVEGTPLQLGPITSKGANLTGVWTRGLAGGGQVSVQAYVDHTRRTVVPTYVESLDIADLQLQHSLAPVGVHSLVWGANYRHAWDDVTGSAIVAFLPGKTTQKWSSLFAQDEITLGPALRATLGVRIERNVYTGNEFLPTARLAWTPNPQHMIWTALSRTVRAPSRLDVDTFIPGAPPYLLRGGPEVRSEVAKVFEAGYRGQPAPNLSYSVTALFNEYDHLRTQEVDPTFTYLVFDSRMEGRARGLEMWGSYQAMPGWRLSAGLMALHQRFTLKPGSLDEAGPGSARKDPSHTAQMRSSFAIAADKDLDIMLRKVGALANPEVPGYTALDARLAWRPRRNLELSLIGQNLNGSHGEYGPVATRVEAGRSLGLKLVWQE